MSKLQLIYSFDSEEEMREHLAVETRAAAPTAPAGDDPAPTKADVDVDGMPYDEAVHSDPPQFKADGTWRAKRGKADEEKEARAAFKAGGGDIEPPAALPTAAAPAAPTLPGAVALPADAPAPVSFDTLVKAITDAMNSGKIDQAGLGPLYAKHGGADPAKTLETSETARAAMLADLQAL